MSHERTQDKRGSQQAETKEGGGSRKPSVVVADGFPREQYQRARGIDFDLLKSQMEWEKVVDVPAPGGLEITAENRRLLVNHLFMGRTPEKIEEIMRIMDPDLREAMARMVHAALPDSVEREKLLDLIRHPPPKR